MFSELFNMNKVIDDYIEKQKSPQKEILKKVRKIFLDTIPNCKEKKVWGVPTFQGGKFYIAAMKNRVHVGFSINGLNNEEIKMLEGGGKTMRHIKIKTLDDIDDEKLIKIIKIVNEKTTCES